MGKRKKEPPPLDLAAVMTEALRADAVPLQKQRERPSLIRPSALGLALGPDHDGCVRALWEISRGATQREDTPGELLMFKAGNLLHDEMDRMLRGYLEGHGWRVLGTEMRVSAFGIEGDFDLLAEHIETGWRRVYDWKTKRGNAFSYLTEAKPGNVLQVQFYIAAADADDGVLGYIDREGQNFLRDFAVPRNDERPKTAVAVLEEVLASDTPPPCVTPSVAIRENKGADAVYINEPWQVSWCRLNECVCKKTLGTIPSGIAGRVSNPDAGRIRTVSVESGCEKFRPAIVKAARVKYGAGVR